MRPADLHPDAPYGLNAPILVIDVGEDWERTSLAGLRMPPTDWRFHVVTPSGMRMTFPPETTAAMIAVELQNRGYRPTPIEVTFEEPSATGRPAAPRKTTTIDGVVVDRREQHAIEG
jgi:hypothetical protein